MQIIWKLLSICSKDIGKERDMFLKHENITVITDRNTNPFSFPR